MKFQFGISSFIRAIGKVKRTLFHVLIVIRYETKNRTIIII